MESISKLIEIIYDEVKQLENISIPEQIENFYEAVGELSECSFFQNGTESVRIEHISVSFDSTIILYIKNNFDFFTDVLQHFPVSTISIPFAAMFNTGLQ